MASTKVPKQKGIILLDEDTLKAEETRLQSNIDAAKVTKKAMNEKFRLIDLFYSSRHMDSIKSTEPFREFPSYNIVHNVHSVMFNNAINKLFEVRVKPTVGNPDVAAFAMMVDNMVQTLATDIKTERTIKNSTSHAFEFGTGITYTGIIDAPMPFLFEGGSISRTIKHTNIIPTQFLVDNACENIQDALFCMTSSMADAMFLFNTFNNPEEFEILKEILGIDPKINDMAEIERILLFDQGKAKESTGDADDKGQIFERDYKDRKGVYLYQVYYEKVGIAKDLMITYMVEKKIVRRVLMKEFSRYPFDIQYDIKVPHSFWGNTIMVDVVSMMKVIMKMDSIMAMWGVKFDKPITVVANKGGMIPGEDIFTAEDNPGSVIMLDGDNVSNMITHLLPPEIPQTLLAYRQLLVESCYEMTNVNDFTRGNTKVTGAKTGAFDTMAANSTATDSVRLEGLRQYTEDLYETILHSLIYVLKTTNLKRLKTGVIPNDSFMYDSLGIPLQNVQTIDFSEFDKAFFENIERFLRLEVKQKLTRTPEQEAQVYIKLAEIQAQMGDQLPVPLITGWELVEGTHLPNSQAIQSRIRQQTLGQNAATQASGVKAVVETLLYGLTTGDTGAMTTDSLMGAYDTGAANTGSAPSVGGAK